jgi:hypothetical protein
LPLFSPENTGAGTTRATEGTPVVTVKVNACVALGVTPLLAVIVMGKLPPVPGVPLIVAVPLWLSTKVTVLGNEPTSEREGVGFPVVVTVKLPFAFRIKVAMLALVIAGGAFTVTVVWAVTLAGVVAALVTVRVYVVVAVGEIVTGTPLVITPTPLLTLPVPPLNTAVNVVELPERIGVNAGAKLVIAGPATTFTVAVAVTVAGMVAAFVTVSV